VSRKPRRHKKNGVQNRPGGSATSPRVSEVEPDESESALDRMMKKAEHPGRLLIYVLTLVIIVVGWVWPRFVVDPTSLRGAPHQVVAVAIALVMYLSFSTLTFLLYCLLFSGATKANKGFLAVVLNRAGIGATFGTLLGIRLAPALLGKGAGAPLTFPGYLSDVGNVITVLTLVLISTAWRFALGPFMQAVDDSLGHFPKIPARVRKWTAFLLVLAVNGIGAQLAWAVHAELA
jgi:hypothetical protein